MTKSKKQIIQEIFARQNLLSSAMFEAAWRTHPDVDKDDLKFSKSLKNSGASRLRPWIKIGLIEAVDTGFKTMWRLNATHQIS